MKKMAFIFAVSIILAANLFAEEGPAVKEPDTFLQKFSNWINGGYKKDVRPIKDVSVFQDTAKWVTDSTAEAKKASSYPNPKAVE